MQRTRFLILLLLVFALQVSTLWAKEPLPPTWDELVHSVLALALEAFAAIIAALLIRAAKRFGDKTGLEIKYAEDADAREKLRGIILSVEEKFLSKYGLEDKTKRGALKLAEVITKALQKLPFLAPDTIKQLVHEELPKLGLGMLGKLNGNKPVGVSHAVDEEPEAPPDPQPADQG